MPQTFYGTRDWRGAIGIIYDKRVWRGNWSVGVAGQVLQLTWKSGFLGKPECGCSCKHQLNNGAIQSTYNPPCVIRLRGWSSPSNALFMCVIYFVPKTFVCPAAESMLKGGSGETAGTKLDCQGGARPAPAQGKFHPTVNIDAHWGATRIRLKVDPWKRAGSNRLWWWPNLCNRSSKAFILDRQLCRVIGAGIKIADTFAQGERRVGGWIKCGNRVRIKAGQREYGAWNEGGVVIGWMPKSLGKIYSQDVPTGRPGTSLYDVLQSFLKYSNWIYRPLLGLNHQWWCMATISGIYYWLICHTRDC